MMTHVDGDMSSAAGLSLREGCWSKSVSKQELGDRQDLEEAPLSKMTLEGARLVGHGSTKVWCQRRRRSTRQTRVGPRQRN